MFTSEQKKEFIEQGIKEFEVNPKFRKMLVWLIDEMDKTYDRLLYEHYHPVYRMEKDIEEKEWWNKK